MTYGSNYTHFSPPDLTKPGTWKGVVQTLHENRQRCQDHFGLMAEAGLTDLRVPMEFLAVEEYGQGDGFNLALRESSLEDQQAQNLIDLIAYARKAKFSWISLGPGGAGSILGPSNWPDVGTRWERMANLVAWMTTLGADQIDLGELIGFGPIMTQYAQTLWSWGTFAQTQGLIGPTPLTIGLTAGVQNAAAAVEVFRGLDPNGQPNWPREIGLHIEGPVSFLGHGSFYSIGMLMASRLRSVGFPGLISIHERPDFADALTNAEQQCLVADLAASGIILERIVQWARMACGVDFATSPPVRGWPL